MEGLHCFDTDSCDSSGLTEPVAEYPHSQGCAVVGGTVYRGSRFISLQGIYFYADFCFRTHLGLAEDWRFLAKRGALLRSFHESRAIGEDEDGNLYVSNYSNGLILRLEGRIEAPAATAANTPAATASTAEDARFSH